jgi:hypothetical protein
MGISITEKVLLSVFLATVILHRGSVIYPAIDLWTEIRFATPMVHNHSFDFGRN